MKQFLLSCVIASQLCGCAAFFGGAPNSPKLTQLQTREMQTREFAVRDEKLVLKAVLNALQDDGFAIKNAVSELGIISAIKEVDLEDKTDMWLSVFMDGENARWLNRSVVEATINLTKMGNQCRVRVSFQKKLLNNRDEVTLVESIQDMAVYQEFFSSVDKAIFIQLQGV